MIELERTYLAKYLPKDLAKYPSKEIADIFIPKTKVHPNLRIRKNGIKFEITKKEPIQGDSSKQLEQTIPLNPDEYESLQTVDGKKFRKIRYNYPSNGRMAEIDIYQDDLAGLVVVDFEFDTEEQKAAFEKPDFCLVEVTAEEFLAGGMLCGKKYADIEPHLKKYDYQKIQTKP